MLVFNRGRGERMARFGPLDRHIAAKHPQISPRRKWPLDMLHANPFEMQVGDRLLTRAYDGQESFLHRGRHDLVPRQIFSRPGPVGKDARLAIQVPFAGLVQHFQGVFEVTGFSLTRNAELPFGAELPRIPRVWRRERKRLRLLVDSPKGLSAPSVVGDIHQLDVAWTGICPNRSCHARGDRRIFGRKDLALDRGCADMPPGRLVVDVGRSGPDGPRAAHKQLAEVPLARTDLGHLGRPNGAVSLLPARYDSPAAEHHFLTRRRCVGDRMLLVPGILRAEDEGLGLRIDAATNRHHDVLIQPGSDLLAHRIPRLGQAGERSVGRARVGVLSTGCDVEVGCDCRKLWRTNRQ